jgi:hypothetical protein
MSASGDWGPAPEGIDLTEQQDGEILRPVIALITMGIMAVAIRFVARFKSGTKIAIDDYLILVALVRSITLAQQTLLLNLCISLALWVQQLSA